MPYYAWRGINLSGKDVLGKSLARSPQLLAESLLAQEIAVIDFYQLERCPVVKRKDLGESCLYLADLLESGLRLDEALLMTGTISSCRYAKSVFLDGACSINKGISLSDVLEGYESIIDGLFLTLVRAGEESGLLSNALRTLAMHYTAQDELQKKLKSTILMPTITFIVFCIITLIILVVVIPRFESLFSMLNKSIPRNTRFFFRASFILRRYGFFAGGVIGFMSLFALAWCRKNQKIKGKIDSLILMVPYIGALVKEYGLTKFLHALAVMIKGGVHISSSLKYSNDAVSNSVIRLAITRVVESVDSGKSISVSFKNEKLLNSFELESLLTMGEAIGSLENAVCRAADIYHKKTYASLTWISSLIPPFLIICLGLLVGILIVSVYAPILNLSQSIG